MMTKQDSGMMARHGGWLALATVLAASLAATVPLRADAQALQRRESVQRLFFNQSERQVLESFRQGVVDQTTTDQISRGINIGQEEESGEIELPEIVFREVSKDYGLQDGQLTRNANLNYGGIIRQHSGETRLLLDGRLVKEEELPVVEERLGVSFRDVSGNRIEVEDNLFKRLYALGRGDKLDSTGQLVNPNTRFYNRFIVVKRDN